MNIVLTSDLPIFLTVNLDPHWKDLTTDLSVCEFSGLRAHRWELAPSMMASMFAIAYVNEFPKFVISLNPNEEEEMTKEWGMVLTKIGTNRIIGNKYAPYLGRIDTNLVRIGENNIELYRQIFNEVFNEREKV